MIFINKAYVGNTFWEQYFASVQIFFIAANLYSNTTKDKLHISCIQKLLGDTENDLHAYAITLLIQKLFLEKICSHLLRSRRLMMTHLEICLR